jgi:hypothetical protein
MKRRGIKVKLKENSLTIMYDNRQRIRNIGKTLSSQEIV